MSVASLPSEQSQDELQRIRVKGGVAAAFAHGPYGTYPSRLAEADGYRLRFPDARHGCEAVLLNTGGGVAGGDEIALAFDLLPCTSVTVTTISAERIYRTIKVPARVDISLRLAEESRLAWLPQETILYSGAHLERRLNVDMREDAELTLLDIVVLGRRGSDERMGHGRIDDRWSIRRAGRLIHMEALRMHDHIDHLIERAAVAQGAHVIATLVHLSPVAEDRLPAVRAAMDAASDCSIAGSAWDGKLVMRALGRSPERMRATLASAVDAISPRSQQRACFT